MAFAQTLYQTPSSPQKTILQKNLTTVLRTCWKESATGPKKWADAQLVNANEKNNDEFHENYFLRYLNEVKKIAEQGKNNFNDNEPDNCPF
jgi:hypothetical protein